MEKEIKLPKIAEGAESATVTDVLVKEGDKIEKGQSVIVVESEKASVEVPSEEAGTVNTIRVKHDAVIKPGDVILILETEEKEAQPKEEKKQEEEKQSPEDEVKAKTQGEEQPSEEEAKAEKPAEKEEKQPQPEEDVKAEKTGQQAEVKDEQQQPEAEAQAGKKEEKPEEEKNKEQATEEGQPEPKEKTAGKPEIAAVPNALRLARELGVDINDVEASGAGGKILEEDVTAYARELIHGKLKGTGAGGPLPDFSKWGEVEKKPLSGIRRSIAKRTAAAWRIIPHVTHFDEADMSGVEELRTKKDHLAEKQGGKLTVTAILLKILAMALKEFPELNASIDTGNAEMILKKYVHIGVAVDTENGLLVPVIRDVDKKNLIDLSVELTGLSEKARTGKLTSDEMDGGSFVISNVGGIGGANFTQLIYHPQAAILGVARAEIKPKYIDGEFKPVPTLPLSLTYDHRIIDGADAARFLRWICEVIEDPLNMFIEE
jgi:pyruvate dehydrogenase E2 component (dihydrolipoamide acetyltransferase)